MKLFLICWSSAAFVWWFIALILLALGCRKKSTAAAGKRASISVFKPLPPVRDELERAALAEV